MSKDELQKTDKEKLLEMTRLEFISVFSRTLSEISDNEFIEVLKKYFNIED